MHKVLLLLGLLLRKPLYGYELLQIIRAHGEIYADLKKANLYYLLERLANEGYLAVQVEEGTRGARGERLIYSITATGRARFDQLLRETLLIYEPVHMGIDTAVVFLHLLPADEGLALLEQRRQIVIERRQQINADLGDLASSGPLVRIASDHLLSLIDAEISWIERSLSTLRSLGWAEQSTHTSEETHQDRT